VITYDRRGYARSGDAPVRSVRRHTADAAAILERLGASPAVVFGMSSGATITVDLAVRRPDLVRAAIEHEAPWRMTRHLPPSSRVPALARIGWLTLMGRQRDAADLLLRSAYAYRDGGSAWDAFPEEWRRIGRENARATLRDFINSIGNYPTAAELATIRVPVVCSYGALSPEFIVRFTRSLATAIPRGRVHRIEGTAHAAPFDATEDFVELLAEVASTQEVHGGTFG
jgi:pimeloyl-ACP methyl ester carboxylesterase